MRITSRRNSILQRSGFRLRSKQTAARRLTIAFESSGKALAAGSAPDWKTGWETPRFERTLYIDFGLRAGVRGWRRVGWGDSGALPAGSRLPTCAEFRSPLA